MRFGRSYEEMSVVEQDIADGILAGENPHKHCSCRAWNNDDGVCAFCEWEEEKAEDDENEES